MATRHEVIAETLLADTDLLTGNHDGTPDYYTVAADDVAGLVERILRLAEDI